MKTKKFSQIFESVYDPKRVKITGLDSSLLLPAPDIDARITESMISKDDGDDNNDSDDKLMKIRVRFRLRQSDFTTSYRLTLYA